VTDCALNQADMRTRQSNNSYCL